MENRPRNDQLVPHVWDLTTRTGDGVVPFWLTLPHCGNDLSSFMAPFPLAREVLVAEPKHRISFYGINGLWIRECI